MPGSPCCLSSRINPVLLQRPVAATTLQAAPLRVPLQHPAGADALGQQQHSYTIKDSLLQLLLPLLSSSSPPPHQLQLYQLVAYKSSGLCCS